MVRVERGEICDCSHGFAREVTRGFSDEDSHDDEGQTSTRQSEAKSVPVQTCS